MSLMSLCVLTILANVLDFRSYSASIHHQDRLLTNTEMRLMMKHDINSIPTNERLAICFCRGVALHLFEWIRKCCIIYGPDGSILEDLPSRYLVQIGAALLQYKAKAEGKKLEGVTNCSLTLLTAQVNNIMHLNEEIRKTWVAHSDHPSDSLELEDQSSYRFEWKDDWKSSSKWSVAGLG